MVSPQQPGGLDRFKRFKEAITQYLRSRLPQCPFCAITDWDQTGEGHSGTHTAGFRLQQEGLPGNFPQSLEGAGAFGWHHSSCPLAL